MRFGCDAVSHNVGVPLAQVGYVARAIPWQTSYRVAINKAPSTTVATGGAASVAAAAAAAANMRVSMASFALVVNQASELGSWAPVCTCSGARMRAGPHTHAVRAVAFAERRGLERGERAAGVRRDPAAG